MTQRALQVCYYPIRNALTGGQIRVASIASLIDLMGYERKFMGIYPHRHDGWESDFPIDLLSDEWVMSVPHNFESRLAEVVIANARRHREIIDRVERVNPHILWFEHPFLWPIFREWVFERRGKVKVVYSSHNVEWQMKRACLRSLGIRDELCVQNVYANERDLLRNADLVICCSDDDRRTYAHYGRADVALIPNGAMCPEISEDLDSGAASALSASLPHHRMLLSFVSSQHQPNWFGLRDLVFPHMRAGGILQHAGLILMGDICELFKAWPQSAHFADRVFCAGIVTNEQKSALFKMSDIVVLPITEGGGTNLKTAEALRSTRTIAATDMAFRGFERHRSLAGVYCAPVDSYAAALVGAIEFNERAGSREKAADLCRTRQDAVTDCSWEWILDKGRALSEVLAGNVRRVG